MSSGMLSSHMDMGQFFVPLPQPVSTSGIPSHYDREKCLHEFLRCLRGGGTTPLGTSSGAHQSGCLWGGGVV